MDLKRIKEIRKKVQTLNRDKAKAQGAMESIEKRWKQEFGCSNEEEVRAKIEELKEDIERGEGRVKTLMEKVENAYDWSEV